MTPCEERGWKVGDKFEVVEDNGQFSIGSIVSLYKDDGSDCPLFLLISGNCRYNNADRLPGAFTEVDDVRRIKRINKT